MFKALQFGGKAEAREPTSNEDKALLATEGVELERALIAMDAVLDGQIDLANNQTAKDDKLFTQLATGVLRFIEATVGFETEAVYQAVDALGASESTASAAKYKAQQSGLRTTSFRPGAEYELAEHESSFLGAICMLITQSKIEILKGLYKIRKTYLALEELRKHVNSVKTSGQMRPMHTAPQNLNLQEFRALHAERTQRSNDKSDGQETPGDTIEEYLQSGVEVMAGLLHLILSSVPPNISRLLSVVGLTGDRETALDMLWNACTKYRNIHGSLALIALIMFFDGQLQYCDILLDEQQENAISDKYEDERQSIQSNRCNRVKPKTTAKMIPRELRQTEQKLLKDLHQQRIYYPHGVLWMLQQGRLIAHRNLVNGVAILESDECGKNQMRQVEGLLMFDRTMFMMSLDRLAEASDAFIKLMDVSTWSHPLYMYMAGACQLELYRVAADPTSAEALKHKELAKKYFLKVPVVGGKKKVLGRKMPFDGYVIRKVEGYQTLAKRHNIDVADAVTTSPLYEALYFWNGNSRMSTELAEHAVRQLQYSVGPRAQIKESQGDKYTRQVLEAAYMRCTDRKSEYFDSIKKLSAMAVSGDVENGKRVSYHSHGEPWAAPAALYEHAIYEWNVNGPKSAPRVRQYLSLSADWSDDYELSSRIHMKITGARDRLDIYRM